MLSLTPSYVFTAKKKKRKNNLIFFLFFSFLVILIDQGSKFFIRKHILLYQSIPIIKNIFHFTFIYNKGAAFGLFPNLGFFFVIFTIIIAIILILFYKKIKENNIILKSSFSLILGGAIGNLIDRIRFGKVIDFIDFKIWPIFNLADTFICIGIGLLILNTIKKKD